MFHNAFNSNLQAQVSKRLKGRKVRSFKLGKGKDIERVTSITRSDFPELFNTDNLFEKKRNSLGPHTHCTLLEKRPAPPKIVTQRSASIAPKESMRVKTDKHVHNNCMGNTVARKINLTKLGIQSHMTRPQTNCSYETGYQR